MSIVSKFVKKVKAAISLLFEQLEKENEKEIVLHPLLTTSARLNRDLA